MLWDKTLNFYTYIYISPPPLPPPPYSPHQRISPPPPPKHYGLNLIVDHLIDYVFFSLYINLLTEQNIGPFLHIVLIAYCF